MLILFVHCSLDTKFWFATSVIWFHELVLVAWYVRVSGGMTRLLVLCQLCWVWRISRWQSNRLPRSTLFTSVSANIEASMDYTCLCLLCAVPEALISGFRTAHKMSSWLSSRSHSASYWSTSFSASVPVESICDVFLTHVSSFACHIIHCVPLHGTCTIGDRPLTCMLTHSLLPFGVHDSNSSRWSIIHKATIWDSCIFQGQILHCAPS